MKIKELADEFCSRREAANHLGLDEYVLNNLISQKREVLELKDGNYILLNKHSKILNKVEIK